MKKKKKKKRREGKGEGSCRDFVDVGEVWQLAFVERQESRLRNRKTPYATAERGVCAAVEIEYESIF